MRTFLILVSSFVCSSVWALDARPQKIVDILHARAAYRKGSFSLVIPTMDNTGVHVEYTAKTATTQSCLSVTRTEITFGINKTGEAVNMAQRLVTFTDTGADGVLDTTTERIESCACTEPPRKRTLKERQGDYSALLDELIEVLSDGDPT